VTRPNHHFPDDVLRGFAIGTSPEATRLAVACHLALCSACQQGAAEHEEVLGALGRILSALPDQPPAGGAPGRDRLREHLMAGLPPRPAPPSPRAPSTLPGDLPELPPVLTEHLRGLPDPRWRRLIPGIRAIDLGFGDVWRARLVAFRPGIPIPEHDHTGPEHTVVFQGGLVEPGVDLERGDAATMMPGQHHHQLAAAGGPPCIALIVNERAPRPLTALGRILKAVTRS
jgi:putative transcriptional regulator